MEIPKPNTLIRRSAALITAVIVVAPLMAGEPHATQNLANSEVSRPSSAIDEAQELLRKGDEAYTAGHYSVAVEAYAGARDMIPDAANAVELRAAATERYVQASIESARALSKKGDIAGAKAVVSKVLVGSIAPNHSAALAFLAQLDDPIHTNPALTAKVAKDVDSVRRLLYTAEGAYNLGKYDEAKASYEGVLHIDPTNSAARRGMEQISTAKSDYQKSAYDQARAEMLSEVDGQWATQVPAANIELTLTETNQGKEVDNFISVKNKLDRIIIPKFAVEQATLGEALDLLRIRASENDTFETDPARKGVNFTVNLGSQDSPAAVQANHARIDLRLNRMPLSQVLKYITDVTHTSFTTDDFSVTIGPIGSSSNEMVTQTYRVPPDFISSLSSGSAKTTETQDPFGAAPAKDGILPKSMGAQEVLTQQGVAFPQGAYASYTPASNTLRVVNTPANLEYVTQIVETISKTEPVMVAVRVTMIKVGQSRLHELGYDWLLDNFSFDGSKMNLSGGTQGNGGDLSDVPLTPPGGSNPITAGNRSGDGATMSNSIDSVINQSGSTQIGNNRAPGILAVRGTLDQTNVQAMLRGLDQKKGVDMLAKPSIVTRSGQASSTVVSREFIYPTEYDPPQLPNSTGISTGGAMPVTPSTPTAFKTREVGIILDVLPVVDANKQFVTVNLNPSFTDFDGYVNYGTPITSIENGLLGPEQVVLTPNSILMPVFSSQRLSTPSVDVADGATVVVGGLLDDRVQNVEDETPGLSKLPVVGRLFQSKVKKSASTAIIFLVNVELMDPTGRRIHNP